MVTPKVTVTVTSALAGTILLSSINSQLGSIGYVIYVEYAFYAFFFLCLISMLAALTVERYRLAGRTSAVTVVQRMSQAIFLIGFLGTLIAAWQVYVRS